MDTIKAIITDRGYYTAKTFANCYLLFALYVSFSHIIGLFTTWGSHTAWVAPLLIDSMILIGRLFRGPRASKTARRWGLALQVFGSLCSLAANILAADNRGDLALGVMVITLFLVVELVSDKAKPVRTIAQHRAAAQAARTRQVNAEVKKAAAERKAAAARDRRERDRLAREVAKLEQPLTVADLEADFAKATAPVSPAPVYAPDTRGYL